MRRGGAIKVMLDEWRDAEGQYQDAGLVSGGVEGSSERYRPGHIMMKVLMWLLNHMRNINLGYIFVNSS